jgi:hypothetical protein
MRSAIEDGFYIRSNKKCETSNKVDIMSKILSFPRNTPHLRIIDVNTLPVDEYTKLARAACDARPCKKDRALVEHVKTQKWIYPAYERKWMNSSLTG